MRNQSTLNVLLPLIAVLILIATGVGLFYQTDGEPYALTNFRGEAIVINGRGLYTWDTVSSAAQMQANDVVTLVLGLPLLAVSYWLSRRGSLRGRLLLTGTLGFILYTYITMCFGAAYNALFLVYVALFGLSLFSFILSMTSFDLETLPAHFAETLPRRRIAALLLFVAAFLLLAWLSRIVPTIDGAQAPPLENVTSMFIQAMDLALIVPLCAVAAVLLLRRQAWGYLLASVGLFKFLAMGIAVSLMGLNMARVGAPEGPGMVAVFAGIALANLVLVVALLRNIVEVPDAPAPVERVLVAAP